MFWCTVCIDLSFAVHIQRKMTENKSHDLDILWKVSDVLRETT